MAKTLRFKHAPIPDSSELRLWLARETAGDYVATVQLGRGLVALHCDDDETARRFAERWVSPRPAGR